MGTKRVGMARVKSLINENVNQLQLRRYPYQTISSDTTLTMADAGQIIGVNGASALEITLPAVSNAGAWFRFVLTDNTANVDILQAGSGEDFVGSVIAISAKDTATASDTKVRFASGTALAGDYVEVYSDGASWLISGQTAVNTGIVFA
jgi:hypothetical protein